MSEICVAVVAFDHISPFHLSVPCVVFGENQLQAPAYRLQVCAAETGPLTTSAGFGLTLPAGLEALQQAEVVIVPSWRDPAETAPAPLLAALQAAHARGARIVGLCLGAYVLAQAGLLDGRRATTHWAYAEDFARRFPGVTVDADVLYLDDGPLLTSAGTAAGLDCCLHLLRQLSGAEAANSVARRLVTPPHRQGGQAQYIEQPLPASARDGRLSGLLDWVRANLDQPHSLDSLAQRALLSRRTFTRHFRLLTGSTVQGWLLAQRLALTQRLLETSALPVESIAQQAGFGSPASLRLHFRKAFGVTPSEWRQTFGGHASA
ncbi:AraC family transcriptional regulator [Vogesella sp. EB]|uniref:GlxA family transcriptional regulator n=1 Tax=Vogesella sp. EB TaxID=1526735 RepID=UPI00064D29A7|nr:helix-turn-helix domain-containing protein [Vogesella sp. EB]KMJ53972.1 AraC family transcriptional regulator [Vogesella sp. EB]